MTHIDELKEILADRRSDVEMARWRRSQAGHGCRWDDYSLEMAETAMEEIHKLEEASHEHQIQDHKDHRIVAASALAVCAAGDGDR
jgi:hypothetical protein